MLPEHWLRDGREPRATRFGRGWPHENATITTVNFTQENIAH